MGVRLKPVSSKTAARNREYARTSRAYLLTHPECQIRWDENCSVVANQVHHIVPRAHLSDEQMLDPRGWLSTDNHCHDMTHRNPEEAYKRGVLAKSWDWDQVVGQNPVLPESVTPDPSIE